MNESFERWFGANYEIHDIPFSDSKYISKKCTLHFRNIQLIAYAMVKQNCRMRAHLFSLSFVYVTSFSIYRCEGPAATFDPIALYIATVYNIKMYGWHHVPKRPMSTWLGYSSEEQRRVGVAGDYAKTGSVFFLRYCPA